MARDSAAADLKSRKGRSARGKRLIGAVVRGGGLARADDAICLMAPSGRLR